MKTLIFQNTGTELLRVNPEDILYVEADGNYCKMFLKGSEMQNLWFNKNHFTSIIEKQIGNGTPEFICVGRSLIINCMYIYRINPSKGELIMYGSGCDSMVSLHASQVALSSLKDYIESEKK